MLPSILSQLYLSLLARSAGAFAPLNPPAFIPSPSFPSPTYPEILRKNIFLMA